MSDNMIERVARALLDAGDKCPWDDAPDWAKEVACKMARAAIEAMQTEQVVFAGGVIRFMGWQDADEDDESQSRYFGAMVEFSEPPEGNPFKVIWGGWPVSIVASAPDAALKPEVQA